MASLSTLFPGISKMNPAGRDINRFNFGIYYTKIFYKHKVTSKMKTVKENKLHILGVGGTFMSGIALLAQEKGFQITGSDMNLYPPMSTQLADKQIAFCEGYQPENIAADTQQIVVGNVIKRGNPAMEHVLANNLPYISGPQWLAENILKDRWVIAISGTHGKTTTTSLVTWILDCAGLNPGFLIGGIPENFGISARLGSSPFFVIEADEYDTAFFDKRAKFVHYHPRTLIMNNLEFDHADIYKDLEAIQLQFHYLVRTIPNNGLIIHHDQEPNLVKVLEKGCWTPCTTFGSEKSTWQARLLSKDGSSFEVIHEGKTKGTVNWSLLGKHNVDNALAAISAASHVGVSVETAIAALASFKNVKRRLEVKGERNGITLYDDFAHHPTAIKTTLAGLRAKIGSARLITVLEFGSYTMRSGVHKDQLQQALVDADLIICKKPVASDWGLADVLKNCPQPNKLYENVDTLIQELAPQLRSGDHVVMMSNSGFDGIHQKLLNAIEMR
jgi:UDP-N-acetylmuramate: L-alanyl-gamma-D-glutamyl-meso-diaminopimelate ligase